MRGSAQTVIDALKVCGSYIPIREAYEFSEEEASAVHYSSQYCTNLLENFAECICKNSLNISTDIKSESFDFILKESIARNYQQLAELFNAYFLEGHMASERLHLNRQFI